MLTYVSMVNADYSSWWDVEDGFRSEEWERLIDRLINKKVLQPMGY